jgi:two-component system, chemotaxis family, sensor kinase CheA
MATFREEAEEHLRTLSRNLTALEESPTDAEAIEAAFRATHTLKGAARSVGLADVESRCQGLESVLSDAKRGRLPLTPERLGGLQEGMDGVTRVLAGEAVAPREALRPKSDPTRRPAPDPAVASALAVPTTIRMDTARLDELQSHSESLLVAKLAAEGREQEARALVEALAPVGTYSAGDRASGVPRNRAAETQARALVGRLSRDRRVLAVAVDALGERMRHVRLMPASSVLELLPPMASEMARALGKEVDFTTEGAELEVDRKVLETIKDPLLHLVRNALDHGVEAPDVRERAGKRRRARIAVRFSPRESRRIEVRVEDDGAGIDVAGLRAGAVRARLMSPEVAGSLPEGAALQLAFSSGVSTSPVITDLSGHGLGMAIVRDRVERLGGSVSVHTSPGQGTAVTMTLPTTIATFHGLLVRVGDQLLLLPIEAVERALRVTALDIGRVGGMDVLGWEGRVVPAGSLGALLGRGVARAEAPGPRPCLIVASGGEHGALLVDEVLGEREVLVKELEAPLVRVRHVAGAGLLGGGELALILRPGDLLRALRETLPAADPAQPEEEQEQEARPAAILVVDDSITTRTMEKSLFEAAGYRVQTATDGAEAWAALKTEPFDLVVSDVDMPRLNGFELTARIRSDARLASLPVVLVTALESREDKERGIEVGANAYVIKSGFDQSKLLEIVRRLV